MISLHQSTVGHNFPTGLELPTRLLRQVLVGHGLHLGGRVLVAGCGHGKLVAFLDAIAYDVDAVDDSVDGIEDAQRLFPRFQFHYARLDEAIPAPTDEFDLILVQDLCVYRDNLLELKTRSATANLLACLKPGGDLVFVREHGGPMACGKGKHDAECWKRHLACFPGQLEMKEYHESFLESAHWDWLVGKRPHHDYYTVTLQTPPEKLNQSFWRDFARRGLMTGQASCCAREAGKVDPHRRVA